MTASKIIFFNSFIYAYLNQIGFFGINSDFKNYLNSPNSYWNKFEFIGGYISTLTIDNLFLGPFFVSLIVALGLASFLIKFFESINKNKNFYLVLIHTLFLFSWPIFVGVTNSYRQAVSIGLCFFLLSFVFDKKKNVWLILLFSFFLIFSHKFGKINIVIIYLTYFLNNICLKLNIGHRLLIVISLIFIFIFYILVDFLNLVNHSDNYITGFDLLYFFYFLFSFVFILIFSFKVSNDVIHYLSLFFINMFAFSNLFFFNNSILYERVNWLTFIISILLISFYFSKILKININLIILTIVVLLSVFTIKIHLPENYIYNEEYKKNQLIK
jgi:hypothetical protein